MLHLTKYPIYVLAFILILFSLVGSALAQEGNRELPFWVWIQTTFGTPISTSKMAITTDSQTNFHTIMSNSGTMYAKLESTWGDMVLLHNSDAHERAIAVDSADVPHLAFAVPMPLTYASLTAGGWQSETTEYYVEQLSDIELLPDGSVYLAYELNDALFVLEKSDEQWQQFHALANCSSANPFITSFRTGFDFAVSDDGDVHLTYGCNAYDSFESNEVHYASFIDGVWTHTQLNLSPVANLVAYRGLSIALDNQNEPLILVGSSVYDSGLSRTRVFAELLSWTPTRGIDVVVYHSEASSGGMFNEIVPYESYFDSTGALHATFTTSTSPSQAIQDGYLNYLRKNSDGLLLAGLDEFYENEFNGTYDTFSDHSLFIDNGARPAVALSAVQDNWRIEPIARVKLSYIPGEPQGESLSKVYLPIVYGFP